VLLHCLGEDVVELVLIEALPEALGLQDLGRVLLLHTERNGARAERGRGLDGAVRNIMNAYLESQLALAGRGIYRCLGLVGGFGGIYKECQYNDKIG
jgi:hypothetical protein